MGVGSKSRRPAPSVRHELRAILTAERGADREPALTHGAAQRKRVAPDGSSVARAHVGPAFDGESTRGTDGIGTRRGRHRRRRNVRNGLRRGRRVNERHGGNRLGRRSAALTEPSRDVDERRSIVGAEGILVREFAPARGAALRVFRR